MPYIIMKRSDIPAATLQVFDLKPNTSQRNLTLDPPGQSKYIDPVQNDTVVLHQPAGGGTPILLLREARGLGAWIATNVDDGTGVAATGSVTVTVGNVAPGDTARINATAVGGPDVTFTFSAAPVAPTDVLVGGTEDASATNLATAIGLAANGLVPYVAAAAPGGGPPSPVNLTAAAVGTAYNAVTLATVGANITDSGTLGGGVDANALTAANINTSSTAILALYAFGNLTAAAGVLNLAAVNGAMAAGALTAAQLPEVLDILAGRQYIVPAGVQIDADGTTFSVVPAVGATGGPTFVAESLRDIFDSGSLHVSAGAGILRGFLDSGFVYRGVAGNPNGEAVAVYNDDGTLFVP